MRAYNSGLITQEFLECDVKSYYKNVSKIHTLYIVTNFVFFFSKS